MDLIHSFGTSRLITGSGSLSGVGRISSTLGNKALIVMGKGGSLKRSGALDELLATLGASGVSYEVFDSVEPEPSLVTTQEAIDHCSDVGADLVIAFGGGSALDVGKAVAALTGSGISLDVAFNTGTAVDLPGLPCIAIPTTSGTGSEVTFNSVLTDTGTHVKQSIRGQALLPAFAVVDPELTVSMPPQVTARTGMDALTQALESLVSKGASPITDALALKATALVGGSIVEAYEDGDALEAREAVAYGSLMAGMALANARLGAVHGMAHSLGARLGLPHGLVCAVMLPYVIGFNREVAGNKYRQAEESLGLAPGTLGEYVSGLNTAMGIPLKLKDLGLTEAVFETIVSESLPSGSLKANPRVVEAEDIRDMLRANM